MTGTSEQDNTVAFIAGHFSEREWDRVQNHAGRNRMDSSDVLALTVAELAAILRVHTLLVCSECGVGNYASYGADDARCTNAECSKWVSVSADIEPNVQPGEHLIVVGESDLLAVTGD